MTNRKISNQHYKVLYLIKELKDRSCYANKEGIFKILKGIVDAETKPFINLQVFSTYISVSKPKITGLVKKLFGLSLIYTIFDPKTNYEYLTLTEDGEYVLFEFLKTYNKPFKKTIKPYKPSITNIKN